MWCRVLSVLVVTLLSVLLCVSTSSAQAQAEEKPRPAGSPYDLIDAVNALRASYGLVPYSISATLMAVAQAHADYMAATGRVSHTGAGGSSVTDRLLAAGYPLAGDLSLGGFRSENITGGSESMTAQAAIDRWTGDALHLNTMISSSLTEIGAGVTINGGRVYYVIDCALPTSSGIPQTAAPVAVGAGTPAGAGVIIPVIVATPNSDGDLIHEVKAGQTLWQIAISYGTRIDEIKRLNNLFDNDIYPGMKLLVLKGVILSPTVGLETEVVPATMTSTMVLTQLVGTATPTHVNVPFQSSTVPAAANQSIMGYVIGIIAIALVGGGLFIWLGNVKNE